MQTITRYPRREQIFKMAGDMTQTASGVFGSSVRGESFWRPAIFPGTPRSTAFKALKFGAEGMGLNLALVGLEAGHSARGESAATIAGSMTNIITQPLIASAVGGGLAIMLPLLPEGIAAIMAFAIAIYPAMLLEKVVSNSFKELSQVGNHVSRLQMGGAYTDTPLAEQLRQNALAELSNARQPARRVLGQEGLILHR